MRQKPRWTSALYAVLFAAACVMVCFVCLSVDLYSDDFHYATFTRGGPLAFLQKNIEHYLTFNGRVAVHVLAQLALALGTWAYALACVLMLGLIPLLGQWGAGRASRQPLFAAPLAFLLLFLLIGASILKESVFWVSACFNYLYPFFMTVCAAALCRPDFRNRPPFALPLLCLAAFLCGATTEQCGIFSAFIFLAMAVRDAIQARRYRPPYPLLFLCALAGYLTLFLSPATRARFTSESSTGGIRTLLSTLSQMGSLLFGADSLALLLLAFLCLAFLAALLVPGFPRLGVAALPCAGLLTALLFSPGVPCASLLALLLLCGYGGVLAIALFFTPRLSCWGIFLAAGLGELAIMAFTSTCEPRTLLPFALSLCLAGGLMAAEIAAHVPPIPGIAGLCAAFCLCTAIFLPTLSGYTENRAVRDYNAQRIEEARQTGTLYYRIDHDRRYSHFPMYADGYFWSTFFTYHQLSCSQIYLESETMAPVYVNGARMTSPAYLYEGEEYFPVENIIPALGGSVVWTPQQTTCSINGRDMYWSGNTLYWGGRTWDLTQERAYGYYTICFSQRIFSECFGVSLTYDQELAAYTAQLG